MLTDPITTPAEALESAARAGWNAARRTVYALCEDIESAENPKPSGPYLEHQRGFNSGEKLTAKRIRSAMGSFEAQHDDNFVAAIRALSARIAAPVADVRIEIRPVSDIPAFGVYVSPVGDFESPAMIGINVASTIAAVADGDVAPSDVPAFILETIYHEIGHALEHWVGVEFSEDRVEALAAQMAGFPHENVEQEPTITIQPAAQVQAEAVAGAYAACRDAIDDYPRQSPDYDEWTRYDEQIAHAQGCIDALTPADAAAALARRDAEVRRAALDAAHSYLMAQYGQSPLEHPVDRSRILALIDKARAEALSRENAALAERAEEAEATALQHEKLRAATFGTLKVVSANLETATEALQEIADHDGGSSAGLAFTAKTALREIGGGNGNS